MCKLIITNANNDKRQATHCMFVDKDDNDIKVKISTSNKNEFLFISSFSRMCRFSLEKPWNLLAQQFKSVSCAQNDEKIILKGLNDYFETVLELSFIDNLLKVELTMTCVSLTPVPNASVALVLDIKSVLDTERITMPHILYNNNPSADPERLVPHFGKDVGECLVCEETRFPIPCVNVEWQENNKNRFVSLFSRPSGSEIDWSLGCVRYKNGINLVCASGILALNGKKDETYGTQCKSFHLENGYYNLQKGDLLTKTCFIDFGESEYLGWGFRNIISSGYKIFSPKNSPCLTLERVIKLKANALRHRWHEDKNSYGYLCVPKNNVYNKPANYYCYGWTGQSLRLAWCAGKLGIEKNDRQLISHCEKAVNFYVDHSETEIPGLKFNNYFIDEKKWNGSPSNISCRAMGEALVNLGKVIRLFKSNRLDFPSTWADSLLKSADFLLMPDSLTKNGVFPIFWKQDGKPESDFIAAAGISCVLALIEAYKISENIDYLSNAENILEKYWKLNGDNFNRPFARATLDARCEDKEAGLYFFLAAYELFLITGNLKFRLWTEVSADWILTFVYFWETGFRECTICSDKGFISTGWPGVSVQNHHLDVFFPSYELYNFGVKIENKKYQDLGKLVFNAWSHGICRFPGDWEHDIPGEQGEQFFQTNFYQGAMFSTEMWKGGYNPWNPSWIIALVMEAGLNFKYG